NNSVFNKDDVTLAGATPANGATLKEDPKITHVDFGVNYAPRGCGEGGIWLGDYSGVVVSDPARRNAQWTQLPGPPAYFGGANPGGAGDRPTKPTTRRRNLLSLCDES